MSGTALGLAIAMLIASLHPIMTSTTGIYTPTPHGIEVDVCAEVYRILDGDTFDAFPVGRVRLADVDAPELETEEGEPAKYALSSLISLYGPRVYLDVDDLYLVDRYNRLIAVAYLRFNETHVLNVNRWLIDNGYATASDYRNEFNPYTWALYSYVPHDPCLGKTLSEPPITTLTITKLNTVTETALITRTEVTTLTLEVTQTVASMKTVTITQTALETSSASPLPLGLAAVAIAAVAGLVLRYLVRKRPL